MAIPATPISFDRRAQGARGRPTYYWATEEDPEKLGTDLWDRVLRYFSAAQDSHHWNRVLRSWLYYHNYYFSGTGGWSWSEVQRISEDNILAAAINEYRAIIDLIHSYVTQDRPSLAARATKTDENALLNARWGDRILEDYLQDKGLEDCFGRAVKEALILTEGFIYTPWERYEGPREFLPETDEMGQPILGRDGPKGYWEAKGDFCFGNPSIFDIVRDLGVRDWKKNKWICVRSYENRWTLAARLEGDGKKGRERADKLVGLDVDEDSPEFSFYRFAMLSDHREQGDTSDILPVWNFYHLPDDALPDGRFFQFTATGLPLMEPEDFPYQEDKFPLARVVPGETALSQLGYSPAIDLQGPMELLNSEVSTIASNHHGCGYTVIWRPEGSHLEESDLGQGVIIVSGGPQPPQGINFNADSPGQFKFWEMLSAYMGRLSGMNEVARGQTDPSLRSAEALKVMESRAHQSTSALGASYARAMEYVGTFILRTLREKISDDETRQIQILGEDSRWQTDEFSKSDLEFISGVRAEVSNPLSRTITGRFSIADMLMQRGFINTPEELLTVLHTGEFEPAFKGEQAQLDLIHDENNRLRKGEAVEADMILDHHLLHIREHYPLINSVEARNDPQLAQLVRAHLAMHFQATLDPNVMYQQSLMGFRLPQMPPPAGPAPGPGGPPQPPGAPSGEQPGPDQSFEPEPDKP